MAARVSHMGRREPSDEEGGEVMSENSRCGCEEQPIWAALDALGVEYECVEM